MPSRRHECESFHIFGSRAESEPSFGFSLEPTPRTFPRSVTFDIKPWARSYSAAVTSCRLSFSWLLFSQRCRRRAAHSHRHEWNKHTHLHHKQQHPNSALHRLTTYTHAHTKWIISALAYLSLSINILPALWHVPQSRCSRDCYGWVRFFSLTTGSFNKSPGSVNSFVLSQSWGAPTHVLACCLSSLTLWQVMTQEFSFCWWSCLHALYNTIKQWPHPVSRGRHCPKSAAEVNLSCVVFFWTNN